MKVKQLIGSCLAVAVLLCGGSAPVFADAVGRMVVQGDFQTASNPNCIVPADNCIADKLTGDFVGRNELTTLDYTETDTLIQYHDSTVVTVSGVEHTRKQFVGDEHGKINVITGHFHSCAELTATDGSGDTLIMRYNGFIDLENNHDSGHYRGAINSPEHCPNVDTESV